MFIRTSAGGGPNLAADAGFSGGGQSGPGASQGATGNENAANAAATSIPGGGSATGNQTGGGPNPAHGGLASILAGGPEAGAGGASGNENAGAPAATALPDQSAGQPKGKPGTNQSNDNSFLPSWASQLSKKLTADPKSAAALAEFKNLDEFVQAYLDDYRTARADGGSPPPPDAADVPGEGASPEQVQAFYERLGKPAKADGYRFAKENPDFAGVAFDANLTSAQAEALYAQSLAQFEAAKKSVAAGLAADIQSTDALLAAEYGQRYDEAMALYQRGIGIDPKTGALSPLARSLMDAGLAAKPELVRAFIELGRATSEGTAAGGSSAAGQSDSVMSGRGFSYKEDYYQK